MFGQQLQSPGGRARLRRAQAAVIAASAVIYVATGAPAAIADGGRTLEQVSPVNKLGNPVMKTGQPATAVTSSADGKTVMWAPPAAQGDDPGRGFGFPMIAERQGTGWESRNATRGPVPGTSITAGSGQVRPVVPSADRTSLLFSSNFPFTLDPDYPAPPLAGSPKGGIQLVRGDRVDWLSKPTWAGSVPDPPAALQKDFMPIGGSDDLSTVYFATPATLTPDDDGRDPEAVGLYRWHDGQLSAADILPDGSRSATGATAAGLPTYTNNIGLERAAAYGYARPVPRDGQSITFITPGNGGETYNVPLYLSRVGEPTIKLSGTTGVVPVGAQAVGSQVYAVSSEDGRYVVFAAGEALTPDAVADNSGDRKTYRYDAQTDTLTYLADLTMVDPFGPANVLAMSADGSKILFRNDAGELRIWRDGGSTLTVSSDGGSASDTIRPARFSADGSTVTLMSDVALQGEPDHAPGTIQVYRYAIGDGQLDCVSCQAGATSGNGKFTNYTGPYGPGSSNLNAMSTDSRAITADGKSVFFDTPVALSADDLNSVADVYEWRDGETHLVSRGRTGGTPSYYVDSSESGDDVFILTGDNIGADDDDLYDVYDAKVGGGFPIVEPPAACVGDGCQRTPVGAPGLLVPGSPVLGPVTEGAKDVPKPVAVATLTVKRKATTSKQVTLSVRASGAGKLRASGSTVRTANRTVKRSGAYAVKVKLTSRSLSTLAKRGRLKVQVRVQFTPTQGKSVSKTVKLTIKRSRR